jgi:signal transduction histidine kinase
MSQMPVHPDLPASPDGLRAGAARRLSPLLGIARMGWWLMLALALALYIGLIPAHIADAHVLCARATCRGSDLLTPENAQGLRQLGLSLDFYALFVAALFLILELGSLAVGVVLFWRKSDDPMALLASFVLVTFGATSTHTAPGPSFPLALAVLLRGIAFFGSACFGCCFYLFPSGRFVPGWTRWLAVLWVLYWGWNDLVAGSFTTSSGLNGALFFGLLGSSLAVQIYRYRRVSTTAEHQQTKWVVYGLALALCGFMLTVLVLANASLSILEALVVRSLVFVFLGFIPLSIALAVLRYRLWDIDVLINRTLVYAALTACVIGCYILVVGYLGALFRTSGNLEISLVATGLVAVLFQPLRGWLQRSANRLMYGQRDEPYTVVSRLARRLEDTMTPDAALPAIVETVAQALKLPYVAITLKYNENFQTAAAYGTPVEGVLTLPLSYQGTSIGQLLLGPRQRGEPFTPADYRIFDDLSRQIGIVAHAAQLASDLQRSREQLVTACEEERRRLRRDLHDGLGPTLAALALKTTTVSDLIPTDPGAATQLSNELYGDIRATVGEIRRLVYELRPPRLDDLGLVGAIREAARQQSLPSGLQITVEGPERLPVLPAAVEVAAYRIAQEALTNVARHAQARACTIHLTLEGMAQVVQLEITDDGVGLPLEYHGGVGLRSMRERATELGGDCDIERNAGAGTRVRARLPIPTLLLEDSHGIISRSDRG